MPARADLPSFLDSADLRASIRCSATAFELVALALMKRPHLVRVGVRARLRVRVGVRAREGQV